MITGGYLWDFSSLRRHGAEMAARLGDRSRLIVRAMAARMETIILFWLLAFGAGAAFRTAFAVSPIRNAADFAWIFLPYALAALAPVMGYRLAMAAFPASTLPGRTGFRLAFYGRWRPIDALSARTHPAFGPFGFMASLLIGMLLNVPVRSFEFLLAVPAMNWHAPGWGSAIFLTMAFDVIAMNFLYAVCFVMALRSIPLFPRMLLFAWIVDLMLQFGIARTVAAQPGLPDTVAAPLGDLLSGNVTKVLISAAIWLPYLLLSDRVNVTYRSRVAVG
jgi:hypothetical protein